LKQEKLDQASVKGVMHKMDIEKMIINFYNNDFRDGVRELIISGDRDSLLKAQEKLDGLIIGFYRTKCYVWVEDDKGIKKYGLKVHFDKL